MTCVCRWLIVSFGLFAAVSLSTVVGSGRAAAAKPCHSVEVERTKIRVAVSGGSCEIGREVAAGYLERALEGGHFDGKTGDGAIYYDVDGFRCLTGPGGRQMACRHHGDAVYTSSWPKDHPANFDKPPPSGSSCASVPTGWITGREVKTTPGFGCSGARKVMRKYFRLVLATAQTDGGCAQKRSSWHLHPSLWQIVFLEDAGSGMCGCGRPQLGSDGGSWEYSRNFGRVRWVEAHARLSATNAKTEAAIKQRVVSIPATFTAKPTLSNH